MISNTITKNTANNPQNTPIQRIIYKPGPDLFMADWLSRQNCEENKDEEITGRQANINTIQTTTNIPECMMIHELQQAMSQDNNLQQLEKQIDNHKTM